ncbi:uroporphyrinogen decarboxylase family protein [Dysgonomonas sp. 520]|uniref:uroporphyrinogen decarboxylase family protein n=1 Tax=Dysgonomonas sp. 520 TaxID=2302931 RepID=UPI0013D658C4|nr:uroporphyrinogen decarboxylase family protein [Dysgonomonas sp. 520]NDW09704.1 methylcobamide--CoM methyltransferase [Dysgonomonas sp. 520]
MNFIKEILESEKRLAIPIMTHPGIEALGKIVKEAVCSGEIHYEAIKYLVDKYDTFAGTAIMDLTVEAEAFGTKINMPDEEVPSVIGRLVSDLESVEALAVPNLSAGRIPEYIKANKLAAENIKNKPILSGCIGPYSLAGRLYDMSEIMVAIYIDPDTINILLQKCTDFLISYCKALKQTGTAGVIMAEPAAGLLSNEDCMEYSTKYVKQIVDAVQDETFAVILHNCGNTGQCNDAMIQSGANALHFGNKIDMAEVLRVCPENIVVSGNLDPVGIFKQADKEEVAKATNELLNISKGYKNFVISSGCDLPPHVSTENIDAFFDTVKAFNNQ